MADADAVKQAQEAVANLHLDEVTGERVSKSELKKRQKMREVEKKKAEKAAAAAAKAPAGAAKKKSAEEDESELTPNVRSPVYCVCQEDCWLTVRIFSAIL